MRSFCISCWNIQGLHSSVFGLKSTDPEFLKNTVGVDILILTETWCREDTPTHCPSGYCEVIVPSLKLSTVHRGRDSGGLLVWYRRDLADHISAVKLGKSHCWIKLNRLIGLSETDTYLCAVYTPPIESPYYDEEDVLTLHTEISHFQAQGNVLLCGDFNARTGSKLDYIDPQGNKHVFGQSSLYLTPTLRSRNNLDRTTNKSGTELVQLCRALGLYMLNGRIRGDSFGRFTYCSALGASVVDYAITDMDPSSFNAFTVRQQTPLSDHSQINVYLKWSHQPKQTAAESSKLYPVHRTYRWAPDSAERFIHALQSEHIINKITNFINTQFENSMSGVNLAVNEINSILHIASSMADLQRNKRKQVKRLEKEKWFDFECQSFRKELRNLSNLKHRQPENEDLRIKYCETLKQYKHLIQIKRQNHTNKTLRDIEDSIKQNQFWEMWNNLSTTKPQDTPTQNSEIWKQHFENLYKEISQKDLNSNYSLIRQKLRSLERSIKHNQNPLDYPITHKELAQKLKHQE